MGGEISPEDESYSQWKMNRGHQESLFAAVAGGISELMKHLRGIM